MPNSLQTGVSGLIAHQRQLDVVANNLANMNTTAFKTQRVLFADLIYERLSPATGSTGTAIGGTNPLEVGSGVRLAQIQKNFSQGGLTATGQPFDIAIQGEGFFVLNNSVQDLYTRSGAFSLDAEGFLIDPATGFTVQRFGSVGEGDGLNPGFQITGDKRINIPLGSTILGNATQNVGFDGILSSSATGPMAEQLTSSSPYQTSGQPATLATLLNDLDSNVTPYQAGDVLEIAGTNPDGNSFSTTMNVDGTTTLGDLINAINAVVTDATATLDANGNLLFTADETGPASMSLFFQDATGNTGETAFSLHSMIVTTNGKNGDRLGGSLEVFDVRGDRRKLTYEFQKVDDNTWNLSINMDSSEGTVINGTVNNIQFNDDGSLLGINGIPGANGEIELLFNGVSQSQTIGIDVDQLFHVAGDFDMAIVQDGNEPSKLTSVRVNSDGILQGISSTGQTFNLAQMAIAQFRNPSGLSAMGNLMFESTLNSGEVQLGTAASGGRGILRGGQLEASNVDVAFEFTQLIVAQRGFSANARTITVSDQVLQELTNIIR